MSTKSSFKSDEKRNWCSINFYYANTITFTDRMTARENAIRISEWIYHIVIIILVFSGGCRLDCYCDWQWTIKQYNIWHKWRYLILLYLFLLFVVRLLANLANGFGFSAFCDILCVRLFDSLSAVCGCSAAIVAAVCFCWNISQKCVSTFKL